MDTVCVCLEGGGADKKNMDKRCILRHFKPFCKSCFLTLLPTWYELERVGEGWYGFVWVGNVW